MITSCLLRLLRIKEAAMLLEETDYSCDVETGYVTTGCMSSEALILAHNKKKEEAVDLAEQVLQLSTVTPLTYSSNLIQQHIPYSFYLLFTYENLCFLFYKLTRDNLATDRLKMLYKKSITAFRSFAKIHPMARPSLLLQVGRYEKLQNNHRQALACFQQALQCITEKNWSLPYYQGLL